MALELRVVPCGPAGVFHEGIVRQFCLLCSEIHEEFPDNDGPENSGYEMYSKNSQFSISAQNCYFCQIITVR